MAYSKPNKSSSYKKYDSDKQDNKPRKGGFGKSRSDRSDRSYSEKPYSDKPRSGGFKGPRPQRAARPVKKFDPSLFIKKVEEKTATEVYKPKHAFTDFAIADQIKDNIIAKGYTNPTPIQDQVIPLILEGKDVIATANTGTGKTAAFLIPLVHKIITKQCTRALIITPTRELALQIQTELKSFAIGTSIKSAICIGGVNIIHQINDLKRNPEFVIGTPGRLKDLESNGDIRFSSFDAIVLDEVDTMLDMGFINDIKYIIAKIPTKRHSLFFSATIHASLKEVMAKFLKNPTMISVKTRQSAESVNQDVIRVAGRDKVDLLHDLLIKPEFKKVIIFLRTKWNVDKLARILRERGFHVATIHGNKSQSQRNSALASFKNNIVHILLATDVVARGIDIDDVTHVINYELPQTPEDYIHRIGRTGRADKVGQAITFVD